LAGLVIACLATGWLPWQARPALATGDPGSPNGTGSATSHGPAGPIGSCRLRADTRAWPGWLVEGLRAHPDDQATPTMTAQPAAPVRTAPRHG
jgi:hypothetical protein